MHSVSDSNSSADILFIDNGTNFFFFGAIASALKKKHLAEVRYLTLVSRRTSYLKNLGLEADYFDLARPTSSEISKGAELVRGLEQKYPEYRLSVSLKSDRILRHYPRVVAERLIFSIAARFSEYISVRRPKMVLGEISWAIEHLMFYLCESQGIPYRHLLNLPGAQLLVAPFDAAHSAAGTGLIGSSYGELPQTGSEEAKSYYELCNDVKGYAPSPLYFVRNAGLLYSRNDYRQALFYRVRRLILPLYGLAARLLEALCASAPPEGGQHALLVMHVQPESTPDYVAPFHNDQYLLARQVAAALPDGQYLYIKDHPNVLSIRNIPKILRLICSGKIKLLRRKLPGRELLSKFDVIVSIAGTALLEAAREGIPAISMSDVYLNELPNVIDGRKYSSLSEAIHVARALDVFPFSADEIKDFLARFGLPGFVHDARIAPDVMKPSNIENISQIILIMLKRFGNYRP